MLQAGAGAVVATPALLATPGTPWPSRIADRL